MSFATFEIFCIVFLFHVKIGENCYHDLFYSDSTYYNYLRQQHLYEVQTIYRVPEYDELKPADADVEIESRTFNNKKKHPNNQSEQIGNNSSKPDHPFLYLFNKRLRKPMEKTRVSTFESCRPSLSSAGDQEGVCMTEELCLKNGGLSGGLCESGNTCCLNTIASCNGIAQINNTYWRSPYKHIRSTSLCSLSLKLDSKLEEQNKSAICQVRLDFVSFSIKQPSVDGKCSDTFRVLGSSTDDEMSICGDNTAQHMYFQVNPSDKVPSELLLIFQFGETNYVDHFWNIKIAMLPCGAPYLAPPHCLQYHTTSVGRLESFNWKEVGGINQTRQLNDQNYNICFRSEKINSSKRATKICLTVCPNTTSTRNSFSLTLGSNNNDLKSSSGTSGCQDNYILFANGRPSNNLTSDNMSTNLAIEDRFCGSALHPIAGKKESVEVCSDVKPFTVHYHTADGKTNEMDSFNQGFCLIFKQF